MKKNVNIMKNNFNSNDLIEVKLSISFYLIQAARIFLFILSISTAIISINVQHEFYTYFTMGNEAAAYFIAIVFVSLSIVMFEYYQFLKKRNRPSGFILFVFILCMFFIGFGTFSGTLEYSQKTKKINLTDISKNNKFSELWSDITNRHRREMEEYNNATGFYNESYIEWLNSSISNKSAAKINMLRALYNKNSMSKELDNIEKEKKVFLTNNQNFMVTVQP